MDDFDFLEAVWNRAKSEGSIVRFGVCTGGEAGWFFPRDWPGPRPRPQIQLHRPYYEDGDRPTRGRNNGTVLTPEELRNELITLAHEYGHFASWNGRTPAAEWARYFETAKKRSVLTDEFSAHNTGLTDIEFTRLLGEALQTGLAADEIEMIMREEALAWEIGRDVLASLQYDHLDEYDTKAKVGLHNHRVRLGIEQFAPGECELCAAEVARDAGRSGSEGVA